MEVGVFVPLANGNTDASLLRALGPAVEERGFESLWVPEHVVLFDDYESSYPYSPDGRFPGGGEFGLIEPFTALTYLAAVTDRVRLGTAICLVPQRNPVYTAKQVADLDALSGGRVDFGIGIGWLEEEFDALNVPFARRGARTDEYLAVMRSLWTDDLSEHHGEHFDLPACRMYPKPVQAPHPPIHVGGESRAAMRRAVRHGQGWFSFNRRPEDLAAPLAELDEVAAEHGRPRDELVITVCPYFNPVDAGMVQAYAEAGVDRLIVLALAMDGASMEAGLDQLVTDVLEPARG